MFGFDSLAFQKSIDSQKSEGVPESAVMARPLVTCELPGRRKHFIKGKDDQGDRAGPEGIQKYGP
jgi:hypothetical protein